jgi:hypothetical protein
VKIGGDPATTLGDLYINQCLRCHRIGGLVDATLFPIPVYWFLTEYHALWDLFRYNDEIDAELAHGKTKYELALGTAPHRKILESKEGSR